MKKVLLRIGSTFLIVVLVAICLVFLGMAYLFLFPKGELFGIVYISEKSSVVYSVGEYDTSQLNQIELITTGFDVAVKADNREQVSAYVRTKVNGFALKKNSEINFEHYYDENELKLTLIMREPTGWIGASGSYVKLLVPENLMSNDIKIKITTGKKSNVEVVGGENTKLSELDVTLNRGELKFDSLQAENIFIKANNAKIIAGPKVSGITSYMALDIGSSSVNLLNAGGGDKYLKESIPEINKIDYKVENLAIKNITKRGDIKIFSCAYMFTATSCEATDGNVVIYYLGKANIVGCDASFDVYKLVNEQDSIFKFYGRGGISISNNYGILNATTNSGTINIGMSNTVMALETNSGKIEVVNARRAVSLITSSGSAYVKFAEEAKDGSYTVQREIITLRTYYGNIKIEGLEKINAVVDKGGEPTIELRFKRAIDQSIINAEKANLKVIVPNDEPIRLIVTCEEAMLEVDVGTATYNGYLNGEFIKTVYSNSTTNILQINTLGKVKLISEDIYELEK